MSERLKTTEDGYIVQVREGQPIRFTSFKLQDEGGSNVFELGGFQDKQLGPEDFPKDGMGDAMPFELTKVKNGGPNPLNAEAIVFSYKDQSANGADRWSLSIKFETPTDNLMIRERNLRYLLDGPNGRVLRLTPRKPLEISGKEISIVSLQIPVKK